ncbi:MAG: MEDS domain-containing protein [Usitatibacter sp.]
MGVTVCGQRLDHSIHICAFFDSEREEYSCLAPYFAEGLDHGEQLVSIRDAAHHGDHLAKLRDAGLPVDEAIVDRRFKLMASEETYLKDECFESERMFSMLQDALEQGEEKFGHVRTCGEMSWALRNVTGTDQLMEYEARVNQLLPKHRCTLMCVYDVNRFSGRVLLDALSTHPYVIVNNKLVQNQYFVPPLEYLTGRLGRGTTALAREGAPA